MEPLSDNLSFSESYASLLRQRLTEVLRGSKKNEGAFPIPKTGIGQM